jgi:PKD repeat protein
MGTSKTNTTDALTLAALSTVSAACLIATPAPADLACQARASYSFGTTWDFEALYANESGAIGFLWNFGDGGSSTLQNPSHNYTSSGIYHATLTVTDAGVPQQTCRDTVEIPVNVSIDPGCFGGADPRWGDAPLGVQFSCGGSGFIHDPPPYSVTWSFGDGETSDLCSPYHVYSVGTYWAVFTFTTSVQTYQCSTVRITALESPTPVLRTAWGRLKQLYR